MGVGVDPASLIVGVALFVGGFLAARLRRRHTSPMMCPCGHAANFHEEATGICHGEGERVTHYDPATGKNLGWHPIRCACQRYLGPEILPGVFSRPLELPPNDGR